MSHTLLWNHVEKSNTKIAKKVFDCMNEDNFSVVFDDKIFWFEKTWSGARLPNYVYDYAIKFYERLGYTHISHLPTK